MMNRYTQLLIGVSSLALAMPVEAQTAAAPSQADAAQQSSGGIEDIIVTAQKRSENVQDVPIAVAAFGGAALQERGVSEVVQLANYTPSVQLTNSSQIVSSPSMLSGFIRGIGQDDFSASFEPGVGTYVDGVYLARTVGANANLLDIERIEILKGPQGTLFGRNTIGGAISVVTSEPSSTRGMRGQFTVGRFNRLDVGVVANIPLIEDRLLSSIAISSSNRDGFQKRIPFPGGSNFVNDPLSAFVTTGLGAKSKLGGGNEQNVRAKLLWKGTDGFRVTLTGDYGNARQSASPSTLIRTTQTAAAGPGGLSLIGLYNTCINTPAAVLGAIGLGAVCGPRFGTGTGIAGVNVDTDPANNRLTVDDRFVLNDPDKTYASGNNYSHQRNYGLSAIVDIDLTDAIAVKSITAYRNLRWNIGADVDGTPVMVFEPSILLKQHQFSQELQLSGKAFDNRLNWLVGAYYFDEKAYEETDVIFPGALQQIYAPNDLSTKSFAAFTHLNFALTDTLSFTLGARYTEERKRFEGGQTDLNQLLIKAGVPPVAFPDPSDLGRLYPPGLQREKFSNFSPRLGVEFKPMQDVMLYGSYSRGYKSGGWTSRVTFPVFDAPSFGPEKAETIEVGVKSQFFDRHLQINAAAFTTKYKGIQLNIQRGVSPTFENAGDARIKGIELESQVVLTDALRFNASVGYIDAHYLRVNDPTGVIRVTSDLPKVPKWTAHVGPEYRFRFGNDATLTLRGDYSYRSRTANDPENSPDIYSRKVSLVDLSVSYAAPGNAWSLTAGGKNVFDTRYIVNGVNQLGGVGNEFAVYNRPADWYLTFAFKI